MAGRHEGGAGATTPEMGSAAPNENEYPCGGGLIHHAPVREVQAFLDELNQASGPDEAPPAGFSAAGPNRSYLHFLRRRVHAMRADNLLLRTEAERLTHENALLRQHLEAQRQHSQETIAELIRIKDQLEADIRQTKRSRGWRLAHALRGLLAPRARSLPSGG